MRRLVARFVIAWLLLTSCGRLQAPPEATGPLVVTRMGKGSWKVRALTGQPFGSISSRLDGWPFRGPASSSLVLAWSPEPTLEVRVANQVSSHRLNDAPDSIDRGVEWGTLGGSLVAFAVGGRLRIVNIAQPFQRPHDLLDGIRHFSCRQGTLVFVSALAPNEIVWARTSGDSLQVVSKTRTLRSIERLSLLPEGVALSFHGGSQGNTVVFKSKQKAGSPELVAVVPGIVQGVYRTKEPGFVVLEDWRGGEDIDGSSIREVMLLSVTTGRVRELGELKEAESLLEGPLGEVPPS
jgi:hypothetical protein